LTRSDGLDTLVVFVHLAVESAITAVQTANDSYGLP
jgi:hypothetical protein